MAATCTEKTMGNKSAAITYIVRWKIILPAKAVLAFSFLALSCTSPDSKNRLQVKSETTKDALPVVELFTSEGCSSCPPADRLLSKIKEENSAIVLSYHVDYWDHLGWKDSFSLAAFADRQRQYARHFALESIYTPQAVVNGNKELVGSDERKLRALLRNGSINSTIIDAAAVRKNKETVQVSYKLPAVSLLWLQVALVQPEATTVVKRGENEGRTLHHVNVVRSLKTIEPQEAGTVEITLPSGLQEAPLNLVLFTQQKNSFIITGATQIVVPPNETN